MRQCAMLGVIPKTGGVYSVFLNLRDGLSQHGIELKWVVAGSRQSAAIEGQALTESYPLGEIVAPDEIDEIQAAKKLRTHLENNYSFAIANAQALSLTTNVIRYIDSSFPRIQIVHSNSIGSYRAASAIRDHVHATIGVSPRVSSDLIKHYGFSVKNCISIPNPIRNDFFTTQPSQTSSRSKLEMIYLGRIDNTSKGVLNLPTLLKHLYDTNIHLTVAGDGPDLKELKKRCQRFRNRVSFLGQVPYEKVADTLKEADVYIFPSRYEGFGISLAEAMAVKCLPIASLIRGVTDEMIEHGKTGYLFRIDDMKEAAGYIKALASNREKMNIMSEAAATVARERFSVSAATKKYIEVIIEITKNRSDTNQPLEFDRWHYPQGLRPGLRSYLPENIKSALRLARERFACRMGKQF